MGIESQIAALNLPYHIEQWAINEDYIADHVEIEYDAIVNEYEEMRGY